ncbi:uncharacterized protein F4807DRAFT_459687 [Annulohypoxylon truncatum]|uniref:uncharacterized protein n=1 Tax=Annulohypoxylon truncatum TaxID=327061 RepID=UPI00200792CC|nr:uncharacterized protein F4807DRAFT_459687 [Annulohypoxylon truncatum]KAI1210311.1 hypothetical protein F4807DRAFT_459687 [Annulohypoxylon truncatum]
MATKLGAAALMVLWAFKEHADALESVVLWSSINTRRTRHLHGCFDGLETTALFVRFDDAGCIISLKLGLMNGILGDVGAINLVSIHRMPLIHEHISRTWQAICKRLRIGIDGYWWWLIAPWQAAK